jgi:hypothetical protein
MLWSLLLAGTSVVCQSTACGQLPVPRKYADFYSGQSQNFTAQAITPERYTYDRMFYHNPAVSPYSNLMRSGSQVSAPNYFRYVAPEQQRRQQINTQMSDPRARGGLGSLPSVPQGGLPGAYQNHWYGSRQSLGLGSR